MTGTYGRERAPERACLKAVEWPMRDRQLLEQALRRGDLLDGGGDRRRYSAISNRKLERGYGRWLTYLAFNGQLATEASPADRITRERVLAYIDRLKALGNGTYTLLARLQELYEAALVMGPNRDWKWIRRIAATIRTQHVPVRFPASTIATVRELAKGDGMSVSAWIRHTVEREVAARRSAPEPTAKTEPDVRAAVERLRQDVAELAATLEGGESR